MIYSKAWEKDFRNNTAFIIPYILDDNCICVDDCLKWTDLDVFGNNMFIDMYYVPKSKRQYLWLLSKARENVSYFNSFQKNVEGNIYTVMRFYIKDNLKWVVNMLHNIKYEDVNKTCIVTAVLFWKEFAYKIIGKEETRAARDEQSGFYSF